VHRGLYADQFDQCRRSLLRLQWCDQAIFPVAV